MRRTRAGFTLIEALVTVAVGGIMLYIAVMFFESSSRMTSAATHKSGGLQSLQSTANIIADDVRKATHIYPAGEPMSLDPSLAPGAPTQAGTTLLAMRVPSSTYGSCIATTAEEFVAYYVAPRSVFVSASEEYIRVPSDPANDTQFVMAEYRACVSAPDASGNRYFENPWVRLVMDYVGDAVFEVPSVGAVNISEAGIKLRSTRVMRGAAHHAPGADTHVTLIAFARNIRGASTGTATGQ